MIAVIVAILLMLGTKTYRQCFVWQNSLNLWNELISKYPEGFAAYLNRGQIFVAQGQHNLAIADYTKAIELEPAFPGSYVNRGTVLAQTGRTQEAMADFDKALSLNPTIAEAYFNRAIIKEQNNDFKGALADLLVAQRYHAPIPAYFLKRVEEESSKESR